MGIYTFEYRCVDCGLPILCPPFNVFLSMFVINAFVVTHLPNLLIFLEYNVTLIVNSPNFKMLKSFPYLVFFTILFLLCSALFSMPLVLKTAVVSYSSVWALTYFSYVFYLLLVFSAVIYIIPNAPTFTITQGTSTLSNFYSNDGVILTKLLITPALLLLCAHSVWTSPALTVWFGHLVFSGLQYKFTFVIFVFLMSYLAMFSVTTHFSSLNVYDFTLTIINFSLWTWLLFFSSNVLTLVFFLEILSAAIMLLLITSTFSSNHFYSNTSYSSHTYFQSSSPTAFLQTLMFFFWTTLIASLFLFLFIIIFYLRFMTFDLAFLESITFYLISVSSLKQLVTLSFSWLLLLTCIFLKSGIVPFYLWKPTFFKGMPMLTLFFYVCVYYFSVFFYFVYLLLFILNEILTFNLYLIVLFLFIGTLLMTSLLFESFNLKSFLAMSSILNSVFIFYMVSGLQLSEYLFVM